MGFIMTFELESGQECPHGFIRTDSKQIVRWLAEGHSWGTDLPDRIGSIAGYLGVDTGPLKEIGFEDMPLEEYYAAYGNKESLREHAREAWEYNQQRNQAAWHPPGALVETLETFLAALHDNRDVYEQLGIEETYFVNGNFAHDLCDILNAARWAEEQGEASMRLTVI